MLNINSKVSNNYREQKMVQHFEITLPPKDRGFHLITDVITKSLGKLPENAIVSIFIKHTSAGLTINENCAPSVRDDFETVFNDLVQEEAQAFEYTHTDEGSDDMPAHIKSTLVGHSLTIPVKDSALLLGSWQGIYLCEFRNIGGPRNLVISVYS